MNRRVIFNYKGLDAVLSHNSNPGIDSLLSSTILGTKGGMRYMLRSITSRIAAYRNIWFVSLYKGNRLTGTIGLCYREISQGDNKLNGTYLRYLAVIPGFQTSVENKGESGKRHENISSESMKGKILAFFSKPYLLDLPGCEKGDKNVMYVYVESKNERSKNIIHQVDFQYIRSFLTVAFSRFSPKIDNRVEKLNKDDEKKALSLLREYYKDYSFYTDEFTLFENRYFVIKIDGEIVAGLSVIPTTYKIVDMPGVWGWVFMNILHRLPWYRRLFQPGEFKFLVFGSIYVKEGHEKDLEALMESVCASEGYNTGLTWVDDHSPLFGILREDINMGAINRMLNAKPGLVYANFINLDEKEKEFFYEKPAFISGFDFT